MALEDVVQGVNVKVSTDGVDDAKQQLAGLEKAIESLSKQATAAGGGSGGGGGNAGIPGLTKGLGDLNAAGAEAFAQIARGASNGDITGLATLLGGRLAGSVAEAGKALYEFTERQTEAGLRNAAMAKEFGTTPAVMQGLKSSFEEAGVSGAGFGRLVNRMSRQVASDYPDMMRNVQESNLRAQKSALGLEEAQRAVQKSFEGNGPERATMRLQEAQEKLQKSYGVPAEAFAQQDKLREQRSLQLDQADAIDAVEEAYHKEDLKRKQAQLDLAEKQKEARKEELNDIPHIAQMLQSGMDVAEVSTRKLREAIEYIVNPSGQASPVKVLAQEMDFIKSGAIDSGKALELVQEQMGRVGSGGGGLGALDAQNVVSLAQKEGSAPIARADQNKDTISKLGLSQTDTDTSNFQKFAAGVSEATSIWSALMQKVGSAIAGGAGLQAIKGLAEFGEAFTNILEGMKKIFSGGNSGTIGGGLKELFTGDQVYKGVRQLSEIGGSGIPKGEFKSDEGFDDRERNGVGGGGGGGGGGGSTQTGQYDQFGNRQYDDQGRRVSGATRAPTQYGPEGPIYVQPGQPQPLGTVGSLGTPAAPGAPTINLTVNVDKSGGVTTSGTSGHAGGGMVRGYAGGGRVRISGGAMIPGYADGGPIGMQPLIAKYGPGVVSSVWDTLKQYNLSTQGGRDKVNEALSGHIAEKWGERGVVGGLEAAGIGVGEAAVSTAAGVLTNPFGVGLLDASPVAAADRNSGAAQEEARGRAMGAHSQREMYELEKQGAGIQMAGGGSVDDDEISKQQEAVADAELDAQQHPSRESRNQLAYQKMLLAKLVAQQGASQRKQQGQDRQKQETDRANQEQEKRQAQAQADRRNLSGRLQKLGGTELSNLQFVDGGYLPGFAMGSVRGPGTGTSDSILARLSNGEFVMKDAAVRTYGEGFMHAINNMTIPPPKYADGGMTPYSSLPRFAEGGMERPGSILNLHVGGEVFSGLKAPAAVADQLRKFAIGQQTSATGRKPSWAGE